MKKLHITITRMLPGEKSRLRLEMNAVVISQAGDDKSIAEMLLEAEMHGNDGQARIHIDGA